METWILIWVISAIAAAVIGSGKGEGATGFLVGVLFGPLGVLFAALSSGNRVRCSSCAESMRKGARICPHCRNEQGADSAAEGA
jgi:hypothetical protein